MRAHPIAFWSEFLWQHWILGLPAVITDLVLSLVPAQRRYGFRVAASHDVVAGDFPDVVAAALSLLQTKDKLRYERLRSNVRTVVNAPAAMNYGRVFKICLLDIRGFTCKDPQTTAAMVASALVYNATEGYLLRRGVLRNRRNWERVQRLKWREAKRFLNKVGIKTSLWDSLGQNACHFVPLQHRWSMFRQASKGWSRRTTFTDSD